MQLERLEDGGVAEPEQVQRTRVGSVEPASERTLNGCDGTTNGSPRVTVHCSEPTVTVPEPSKTW